MIHRSFSLIVAASFLLLSQLTGQPCCGQEPRTVSASASVRLDAKACKPATEAQRKILGHEWNDFLDLTISCPVKSAGGVIRLNVISVNGYEFIKRVQAGTPSPELPKAILVCPDGRLIGSFPYAFPFDPPVSLDVTFADWKSGWPQTIRLYLEDPAVGGNRRLPSLKWDAAEQRFVEAQVRDGRR